MMKKFAIATAACLFGLAAVASAEGMGDAREAAMKKIGGSVGALVGIAKGEKAYDADTVKASLGTISETIKIFPTYFPAGSEKDSEEASPKIWENKADFEAHAAKLAADADSLLAALPADQAAVGAAMGKLGANCSGCHELYRIKK
jgi:cytochrome c556